MKLGKNYKVRVTPEQSRQIQELAIKLGFGWWISGKQVTHTKVNNLTLSINRMAFGCFENHREFDADTRFTEISADDLIAKLKKLVAENNEKEDKTMTLDDFLKVKKVRCVNNENRRDLTKGKLYDVAGATYARLKTRDDNGGISWHDMDFFELVIESAENPLQGAGLTPEFGAVEPRFKVGDKVYRGLKGEIRTVERVEIKSLHFAEGGCEFIKHCCHATQENYERLQATFTDIEFEAPPKELTGSDLCRAMLDKGWKYVPSYISDSSDTHALERQTRNTAVIIGTHKDHPSFFIYGSGKSFISYAVPFDPKTGEPLTESVLND